MEERRIASLPLVTLSILSCLRSVDPKFDLLATSSQDFYMLHLSPQTLGSTGLLGAMCLAFVAPAIAEPPPPPPPTFPADAVPAIGYSVPGYSVPGYSVPVINQSVSQSASQPVYYPTYSTATAPYTTAPYTAIGRPFAQSGYLIYIPNSSDAALRVAQTIEPNAMLRQWRGQSVIQAGFFQDPNLASARLRALSAQGLTNARSEAVASGTSAMGPGTGIGGPIDSPTDRVKGYYVVIPSAANAFYPIRRSLQGVVRSELIFSHTTERRGSYVGVGPFADRATAAQVENRLVQGQLENARVYFGSF
jgi:hypothetical protein